MGKKIIFAFVCLAIGITSCKPPKRPIARAYYFWKSEGRLAPNEQRLLFDTLKITKLYFKYFDVVWDETKKTATPADNLNIATQLPRHIQIVPTVFITNQTLLEIDSSQVEVLAANIAQKIIEKSQNAHLSEQIAEWQMDCDWSTKTKGKYFALLTALKSHFPRKDLMLSATIRLHQLKYPQKTGVPPIHHGILMLYNMSNLRSESTRNSILDIAVTRQYITPKTRYPLPLDIALPTFAWGVAFRKGEFRGLFNNWTPEFCDKQSFLQKRTENDYLCIQDTTYKGHFWRNGDRVRSENCTPKAIRSLHEIAAHLTYDNATVALFSWDSTNYQYYKTPNLNTIFEDYESK